MKIHTVVISYNRLELTKQAIESYLATTGDVPYSLCVVDNGSKDGAAEWIETLAVAGAFNAILLPKNRYPGYACNRGFESAPADATHLHRADNDFIFLPGWTEEVERMFSVIEKLGQLGLRTDEEELRAPTNVGGNCVISRELWDLGLRWDERSWPKLRDKIGAGWTEDSLMSKSVTRWGWRWARVERSCIQPISPESADDPYYKQTWADRGIG